MKNIFSEVDLKILDIFRVIGKMADDKEMKVCVVGGFVRDLILRRQNVDIDIVLEGDATAFAQDIAARNRLVVRTHKRFGTATIYGWKGLDLDFVSARSESYPQSGALPVVKMSDLKEDLFRRDFTINAIAVSINAKDFGEVVDHYHGKDDLRKGIIRIFHDNSFIDDPTRIFRAIRFEQRFGFRLAARTQACLSSAIEQKIYQRVSAPRFFKEFSLGFYEEFPLKYVRRLMRLGMLDFLQLDDSSDLIVLKRLEKYLLQDGVDRKVAYLCLLFLNTELKKILEAANIFQWTRKEKDAVINKIASLRSRS